jgi:hypothetical protein
MIVVPGDVAAGITTGRINPEEVMKSGFSRSHWRLDNRLLALTIGLFVIATAAYVCVGLHTPLH